MPHIHTEPGQHDLTVCAYIVRLDAKMPVLVMHKHKKLAKVLQFGGHVELKESPWQALVREVTEESGYDMDQLMLLQPKRRLMYLGDEVVIHPQPISINTHRFGDLPHFHTDIAYGFVTYESPNSRPGDGESTEFVYLTGAQLAEISSEDMYEHVRNTALYVIDECVPQWTRVQPSQFTV
jgi:8-oxo-dGTP pyrophosphatase MutT (NUDIX family)